MQQTFDKPPPATPEKEPAPPGISAQDDSTPPGNCWFSFQKFRLYFFSSDNLTSFVLWYLCEMFRLRAYCVDFSCQNTKDSTTVKSFNDFSPRSWHSWQCQRLWFQGSCQRGWNNFGHKTEILTGNGKWLERFASSPELLHKRINEFSSISTFQKIWKWRWYSSN